MGTNHLYYKDDVNGSWVHGCEVMYGGDTYLMECYKPLTRLAFFSNDRRHKHKFLWHSVGENKHSTLLRAGKRIALTTGNIPDLVATRDPLAPAVVSDTGSTKTSTILGADLRFTALVKNGKMGCPKSKLLLAHGYATIRTALTPVNTNYRYPSLRSQSCAFGGGSSLRKDDEEGHTTMLHRQCGNNTMQYYSPRNEHTTLAGASGMADQVRHDGMDKHTTIIGKLYRCKEKLYMNKVNLYRDHLKIYVDKLKIYVNKTKLYENIPSLYIDMVKIYKDMIKIYRDILKLYIDTVKIYTFRLKLYVDKASTRSLVKIMGEIVKFEEEFVKILTLNEQIFLNVNNCPLCLSFATPDSKEKVFTYRRTVTYGLRKFTEYSLKFRERR